MGRILIKNLKIFLCLLFLVFLTPNTVSAGTYINTYYNNNKVSEISKGVTHISGKRLTNNGIVNVEIIKVDLTNKDLKFENVFNRDVMGKKTTVKNLIKDKKNVVAAVNGDFFEMSLAPSFELGITINDGEIEKLSAGEYYNCYSNSLAAFLLDSKNNPSINFIKSDITFSNDEDTLYISYYNKAGDKEGTVCLSGKYFTTSYSMDVRNPNTYKIVVSHDEIKEIIEPGTTIDIHEDEYVIFVPANFDRIQNFSVGDDVKFDIDINISSDIETAIGGAGQFIANGQVVSNGYIISGKTARSFIGVDSNRKYLMFGTVGGLTSTNSGVTSNQAGEILLDYGVFDAIHLDGGGSSTLSAKSYYSEDVKQVNDVRSQRAIINAFVVSNEAKTGKIAGIKFELSSNKAVVNAMLPYKVFGYDENHKSVKNINLSDVKIESDSDITCDYKKGIIKFNEEGRTNLKVTYKGFETEMFVDVYGALSEIQILPDPVVVEVGDEIDLNIVAFTAEKYKMPIDPDSCDYDISPFGIAKVEDGKVIGLKKGVGTIGVSYDGLKAYSVLAVGTEEKSVENFNDFEMEEISYPDSASCEIENNRGELVINYEFQKSKETQAAYAKYSSNLKLPSGVTKLILDLEGDNKKCMFKVKLVDDAKETYTLTMCPEIDFKNVREFEAELPQSYSGNLYIERYYVVSLSCDKKISSSVSVDNVRCMIPANFSGLKSPASIKRSFDKKSSEITKVLDDDIIFFNNGSSKTMLANYLDNKAGKMLEGINNKKLVVARNTKNVSGIIANAGLNKYEYDDTLIICMSTIAGSAFSKDPYQYGQIETILNNTSATNIIITLDGDLNSSNLAKDKAMLDYILSKYCETRRVNFYVVMFAGNSASDIMDNGIRYIRISNNLTNAYTKNVLIMRKNEKNDKELDYNMIDYELFLKEE